MWELANHMFISKGQGLGFYKLNSFDFALLDANIANYNHSIQSSIIPAHCKLHFERDLRLPTEGSILPTILSHTYGTQGETICAGLAFGVNSDPALPGLVYELHGTKEEDVKHDLNVMLLAAAKARNWILKLPVIVTHSLQVTQPHGCVLVAAVLLP